MSAVTVMPRDTPWSVEDLEHLPHDGRRYELFDGELSVSAAPSVLHQFVVAECHALLRAQCPPEFVAFVSPLDFQPTRRTSLQPDVLVARWDSLGVKNLTVPPVLAVEVLSDSTRTKDLINKRAQYQRYGVLSYWVIDPDAASLVAYHLEANTYRRRAEIRGAQTATVDVPFRITVCPADLVAGRWPARDQAPWHV